MASAADIPKEGGEMITGILADRGLLWQASIGKHTFELRLIPDYFFKLTLTKHKAVSYAKHIGSPDIKNMTT